MGIITKSEIERWIKIHERQLKENKERFEKAKTEKEIKECKSNERFIKRCLKNYKEELKKH